MRSELNSLARRRPPQSLLRSSKGVVSFEFVLTFMAFFTIFAALCDAALFYVTVVSVRTLVSELTRQTMMYCATQPKTATCNLPAHVGAGVPYSADTAKASVIVGNLNSASAFQTYDSSTGIMTVTAAATYNFKFMGIWPKTLKEMSSVSQQSSLSY